MTLPYSQATSGAKALDEVRNLLTRFGASRFGTMTDMELKEIIVQFTYRGRDMSVRASIGGYAKAYLDSKWSRTAYGNKQLEHERLALKQAQISVCSILRDWIKGQITAVETGLLSFEGAFLGQLLLPTGKTVLDTIEAQKMLPAVGADNVRKIGNR